ncbi:integrase arm-type DNA-binding domain-containing protein [Pseudooctadecabacter sp.]
MHPDVSLAQARKAKEVARCDVAEEIDPGEAKQEEKRFRLEAKG